MGITEPGQITRWMLDRYTAHLPEHGGKRGPLSRYSVASFVESVNWWLRWLQAEGELKAKTAAQVPRRPERHGIAGPETTPLTKSGVEQMVRTVADVAGIRKRTYPHLLRHSYATWALNRGMNPIMLAQVLGHSSLAMIQRTYAHSTPADAYELLAKLLADD